MFTDILIIIWKVLWFLVELAYHGISYPIVLVFAIFDIGYTRTYVAGGFMPFVTKGIPFWAIILGLAYLSNPQGMRQGFMRFIARIHYLFAPHPASEILKRADIDDQNDINEAVEALNEIPVEPPPIFKSENMRKKAEANTERYRKKRSTSRRGSNSRRQGPVPRRTKRTAQTCDRGGHDVMP